MSCFLFNISVKLYYLIKFGFEIKRFEQEKNILSQIKNKNFAPPGFDPETFRMYSQHATSTPQRHPLIEAKSFDLYNKYKNGYIQGTLLVMAIPKVSSDSTI